MIARCCMWVEVLLRLNSEREITPDFVRRVRDGDYGEFFPSDASVPMQEVAAVSSLSARSGVSLNSAMPTLVEFLMRPAGPVPERPFNVGDIVHVCGMVVKGGRKSLTNLDVMMLPDEVAAASGGSRRSLAGFEGYSVVVIRPPHGPVSYTKRIN